MPKLTSKCQLGGYGIDSNYSIFTDYIKITFYQRDDYLYKDCVGKVKIRIEGGSEFSSYKLSYETELRKMTSHFELLTRKFV